MKKIPPAKRRGAPRKPAASKRSVTLTLKFTPGEAVNLSRNAEAAEVCRNEFIARRCCQSE